MIGNTVPREWIAGGLAVRDWSQLPILTPELLLGSGLLPPPTGPVRFPFGGQV
jgi:hypothetical protein